MTHVSARYDFQHKARDYQQLANELAGLLAGERDCIANAANTAACIYNAVPRLNWAGFYFRKGGELVLGPFQGKPACVRIALGAGVCGRAGAERKTIVVPDVAQFPGHIACDVASRSEIVIPLLRGTELVGVLDIDSPDVDRFDADDRIGLERLAALFTSSLAGGDN
jgi:L-methionine (R)-S-oxide reductase